MKKFNPPLSLLLWISLLVFGFLAFRELYLINVEVHIGYRNIWESRRFITFLISCAIFLGVLFHLYFKIVHKGEVDHPGRYFRNAALFRILIPALLVIVPGLLRWSVPLPEKFIVGYWMEFFMLWCAALAGAWLLNHSDDPWQYMLSVGFLVMIGGAAHIILYRMQYFTAYPFTLYWSEGNRFFDYSTLFGSFRYTTEDQGPIYAFITWGMQLPWALPFLLPNLSIAAFRLWHQLMWIIPSMALGAVCALKFKPSKNRLLAILAAAVWAFTFLDQGPIYTPLVLAAILTVLALRARLLPGIILIIAASYYAGSARWTWTYAPGLWAGMLALLAEPKAAFSKNGIHNLIKPVSLGIAGYFGGQALPGLIQLLLKPSSYIALMPDVVYHTTRQPLLWQRLLPNPTFSPGILLALLWAILPVVIFIIFAIAKGYWKLNGLQKLGLLAVNAALLVVGIIKSTKIGGGSNLHNLDMFLVGFMLVAFQSVMDLSTQDKHWLTKPASAMLVSLALALPTTYALSGGERLQLPEQSIVQEALETVQEKVAHYHPKGEILFIDHRQLLTFGLVENIPLVDAYEKKVLMDDAMTDDAKFFINFYEDLENRRFALIVNEPSNVIFRGSGYVFGEENDAYVSWVTIPLLCTYEPIYTARELNLELLVPRTEAVEDLACAAFGFEK